MPEAWPKGIGTMGLTFVEKTRVSKNYLWHAMGCEIEDLRTGVPAERLAVSGEG